MSDPHDSPTLPPSPQEAATLPPSSDDTTPQRTEPSVRPLPSIPGFSLQSELGRGGMGVVYLARQLRLNRLVALKMIIAAEHADADTRLRFLTEAETIAKLQHPGIVQVYEFGTHENNPYFALEYLKGGSLDKKLAGTPLPPKEAAALVAQLADAIQAAHAQGIIHRDLKPANILQSAPSSALSTREGLQPQSHWSVKITDFGLVKQEGSDMTATGAILGTPSYMAPEQADGKKNVGPAADIYALGAILYECLTGRPPFKAATPLDTILQVVNDDPVSIRQLQAKTPVDLETICHKCLQKDPAKRYRSAAELAEDLRRYLNSEPITARPISSIERSAKWVMRHRTLTIAALSTAAALVVGLGLALWQANVAKDAEQKAENRANAIAKEKQLTEEEKRKAQRLLALQANREGFRAMETGDYFAGILWFAQPLITSGNQKAIEEASRERIGAYRAYATPRPLCTQMNVISQSMTNLGKDPFEENRFYFLSSVDSTRFLTCYKDNVAHITAFNKSAVKSVLHVQLASNLHHAQFSDDGHYLFMEMTDHSAGIWDSNTGRMLSPCWKHEGTVIAARFSPDGHILIAGTFDGRISAREAATARPLFEVKHRSGVTDINFNRSGNRFVTSSADRSARIWDTNTGQLVGEEMKHDSLVRHARFNSEGTRIVTSSDDFSVRLWDAYTGRSVGDAIRLNSHAMDATFSPNGKRILIDTYEHPISLYDTETYKPVLILNHHGLLDPILSSDGRYLITRTKDRMVQVWDAEIGNPVTPPLYHQDKIRHACFSADERQLIVISGSVMRVWELQQPYQQQPLEQPLDIKQHKNVYLFGDYRIDRDDDSGKGFRVCRNTDGYPMSPWMKMDGRLRNTCFDSKGTRIVAVSSIESNATFRVWSAMDGQPTTPAIKCGNAYRVFFGKHDQSILSFYDEWSAREWDLPVDDRPLEDIIRVAQVYASHKIDETGSLQPLDVEQELIPWYNEMKAKYPDEFIPKYDDTSRWRLKQIKDCCNEHNLAAAMFHQNWLLAEAVMQTERRK